MTFFSALRHYMTFNAFFKAGVLGFSSLALGLSLSAQESDELYRGTWQIESPDEGALILIVKRNGLASYFWGDNADRTVYKGTWSSDETGATLKWADGSSHLISRDALGDAVAFTDAAANTLYTTQAELVPKEVLGQWAKAPSMPDEEISDRDKAKGFFGTWEIKTSNDTYYVIVEPNRSAASNWSPGNASPSGLRGTWAKQGSELHLAWDTGHYGILKQNERSVSYQLIAPGTVIDSDASERLGASRTSNDNLPVEWRTLYSAEKQAGASGIAFSSRKNASLFYRGNWIIQRSEKTFERVEISRFGGLSTSTDSSLEGTWRMTGQDIFMRWDDGMRKVLSPVGQGFLLYEYQPGRPLDGVPTRILSAAPEDAAKFAAHLQGRQDVAEQMLSLAEAAGVTASPEDADWGQTFMRWAWPFGEDDAPQSTDALIQESFEGSDRNDPWWWPFWSEKPINVGKADAETRIADSTEVMAVEEPATDDTTPATADAPKQAKKNWKWPF